jgi:hypothetical protein
LPLYTQKGNKRWQGNKTKFWTCKPPLSYFLLLCNASQASMEVQLQDRYRYTNSRLAQLKNAPVRPSEGFAESLILGNEQVVKLAEWYGGRWKLLYRASRDGWAATDLHSRGDHEGSTVMVVRSKESEVFGGYLGPRNYNARCTVCPSASLFTLVNLHGTAPTKFDVALWYFDSYGSTFGEGAIHFLCTGPEPNSNLGSRPSQRFEGGVKPIQVVELEMFGEQ